MELAVPHTSHQCPVPLLPRRQAIHELSSFSDEGVFGARPQGECRWATFRYPAAVDYQPMTIAELAAYVPGEPGLEVVNLPAADLVPGTAA